jgi:hypothetical protein
VGTERFSPVIPAVGSDGDRVRLVSQAWGDRVSDHTRVNDPGISDTVKPAGLFSTAPYRPPSKAVEGCRGKDGTCRAPVVGGTKYCYFHSPDRSKAVRYQ